MGRGSGVDGQAAGPGVPGCDPRGAHGIEPIALEPEGQLRALGHERVRPRRRAKHHPPRAAAARRRAERRVRRARAASRARLLCRRARLLDSEQSKEHRQPGRQVGGGGAGRLSARLVRRKAPHSHGQGGQVMGVQQQRKRRVAVRQQDQQPANAHKAHRRPSRARGQPMTKGGEGTHHDTRDVDRGRACLADDVGIVPPRSHRLAHALLRRAERGHLRRVATHGLSIRRPVSGRAGGGEVGGSLHESGTRGGRERRLAGRQPAACHVVTPRVRERALLDRDHRARRVGCVHIGTPFSHTLVETGAPEAEAVAAHDDERGAAEAHVQALALPIPQRDRQLTRRVTHPDGGAHRVAHRVPLVQTTEEAKGADAHDAPHERRDVALAPWPAALRRRLAQHSAWPQHSAWRRLGARHSLIGHAQLGMHKLGHGLRRRHRIRLCLVVLVGRGLRKGAPPLGEEHFVRVRAQVVLPLPKERRRVVADGTRGCGRRVGRELVLADAREHTCEGRLLGSGLLARQPHSLEVVHENHHRHRRTSHGEPLVDQPAPA